MLLGETEGTCGLKNFDETVRLQSKKRVVTRSKIDYMGEWRAGIRQRIGRVVSRKK